MAIFEVNRRWKVLALATMAGWAIGFAGPNIRGQDIVYSFQLGPRNPEAGMAFTPTNAFTNLAGTTFAGGSNGYGTFFEISTNGVTNELISFDYTNGVNPQAGLFLSGSGNFYGTANQGGEYGFGTVFTVANGVLANLYSFDGTNGAFPEGGLVEIGTTLYGTTSAGGPPAAAKITGYGTIFQISEEGVFKNLTNFNFLNGANPQGSLIALGTNLYGTTVGGGYASNGTIFRVTTKGAFTNLHVFTFGDGASPCAGLVKGPDGRLYGVTSSGGNANSNGTAFAVTIGPANGNFNVLLSFNGVNGSNPQAGLVLAGNNNFYGTTFAGGANGLGTVFEMTPSGGLTTLLSFNYVNGANPQGVLVADTSGNLYGTTASGGLSGTGTAFRITTNGDFFTLLSFNPGGGFPSSGVTEANGTLYTTLDNGGPNNIGMVAGVTPAGAASLMVPFSGANSAVSYGGLIQGVDTNIYGTTYGGGTSNLGSVFRMGTNGVITNLVSFALTNGSRPAGGLVEFQTNVTNLSLYGTTSQGGSTGNGTIFLLASSNSGLTWALTTVAAFPFDVYNGGAFPEGSLRPVPNSSTNALYGITYAGGTSNCGTVFVYTNGTLTTVASFGGEAGCYPESGLVYAEGYLYGATSSGGAFGYGTVYELSTNGPFTSVVSFTEAHGTPQGPLVEGDNGVFYGTTQTGGTYGYGTVFAVTMFASNISDILTFNLANGAYPNGGLGIDTAGYLYGSTAQGDAGGVGNIFCVGPKLNAVSVGNQIALSWRTNSASTNLEYSPRIGGAWIHWTNYTVIGSQYQFVTNASGGSGFFRLISSPP